MRLGRLSPRSHRPIDVSLTPIFSATSSMVHIKASRASRKGDLGRIVSPAFPSFIIDSSFCLFPDGYFFGSQAHDHWSACRSTTIGQQKRKEQKLQK